MATEIANENIAYLSALRELMKASGDPLWLRELRGRSFDRFERVGFPGVEQEEWKYTNVAPIKRTKFTPVVNSNGTALVYSTYIGGSGDDFGQGIAVDSAHGHHETPSLMGFYLPRERCIWIRPTSRLQMAKTLAHEMAHHFGCHDESNPLK